MTDENKIDEATSDLARSIYHKEKETIKNSRQSVRDLEAMKKRFGWNWAKNH